MPYAFPFVFGFLSIAIETILGHAPEMESVINGISFLFFLIFIFLLVGG